MTIKTNLVKNDRVRLSDAYLQTQEVRHAPVPEHVKKRFGTVYNDTLSPKAEDIRVLWDGNTGVSKNDYYADVELTLVEDEDESD